MVGTGDNHQLFVIAFELLEGILTEVARMRFFPVDDQYGTFDFISIFMNERAFVRFQPSLEFRERG